MEFIIADEKRADIGYMDYSASVDIDVGNTDDFTLSVDLSLYDATKYKAGNFLYCIGTEYGGLLNDPEISTSDNTITFTGDTFRGMLKNKIIQPSNKADYRIISGELHQCIKTLINEQYESIFKVSDIDSGIKISNYQFKRYCSLYDGINDMLDSVGYRLEIINKYEDDVFITELSAVPIVDYSDDIEFSQNSNIKFKIKKYTNKYNYMIALGQGELADREVIFLHCDSDGNVTQVSAIPKGDKVKVYLYDYSSAEDLLSEAIAQFKEINTDDTYNMTIGDNLDLAIGDIVGGRDYVTNMVIAQPVTKKIIKQSNNNLTISYEIGGNE
jgi:hypothetical protein